MSYQQELHRAHRERWRRIDRVAKVEAARRLIARDGDVRLVVSRWAHQIIARPSRFAIIQVRVAEAFGVALEDLCGPSRKYALPRMLLWWLVRKYTRHRVTEIGRIMGRDHSTVVSGCRRIDTLISDPAFAAKVAGIETADLFADIKQAHARDVAIDDEARRRSEVFSASLNALLELARRQQYLIVDDLLAAFPVITSHLGAIFQSAVKRKIVANTGHRLPRKRRDRRRRIYQSLVFEVVDE